MTHTTKPRAMNMSLGLCSSVVLLLIWVSLGYFLIIKEKSEQLTHFLYERYRAYDIMYCAVCVCFILAMHGTYKERVLFYFNRGTRGKRSIIAYWVTWVCNCHNHSIKEFCAVKHCAHGLRRHLVVFIGNNNVFFRVFPASFSQFIITFKIFFFQLIKN